MNNFNLNYFLNMKKLSYLGLPSFKLKKIDFERLRKINNLKTIDFSNNNLTSLSENIKLLNIKNIIKIDLSNNNLEKLPINIAKLKYLKILNLSNNYFKTLPNLPNKIKELDVSFNIISFLNGSIMNYKELEIFNLFNNKIRYLPEEILNLDKLNKIIFSKNIEDDHNLQKLKQKNIDISLLNTYQYYLKNKSKNIIITNDHDNYYVIRDTINLYKNMGCLASFEIKYNDNLFKLPNNFNNISSKKVVFMNNIKYKKSIIPASFVNINKIKKLKISSYIYLNPSIKKIMEYFRMKRIDINIINDKKEEIKNFNIIDKKIDLSFLKLENLTPEINKLNDIEYLNISSNKLSKLPNLMKIRNLKLLDLSSNKFTNIQSIIENNNNLEKLYLYNNKINNFNIKNNLPSLKILNLGFNNIKNIFCNFSNLEELYLNNNKELNYIPESINNLLKLSVLDLSYINLKESPKFKFNLINLNKLDLRGSQINILPEFSEKMTNLLELNLGNNNLNSLPKSIKYLKKLEKLNLEYNNLIILDDNISYLLNLKNLYLNNNNLKNMIIGNLKNLKNFI